MKDKNVFISIGIIIYILVSGIDRFVYKILDTIYILVALIGIILILVGFYKDRHK